MDKTLCDCGHMPSDISVHGTRGYGTDSKGFTRCYDCCTEEDKKHLLSSDKTVFYISCDGKTLTNWPGRVLGKVLFWGERHAFSRERHYVRVRDVHGQEWYGTGAKGMWASLKKCKPRKAKVG